MTKPPDTLEEGRSGPWCQIGTREYKGKPFDRERLLTRYAELSPFKIRLCSLCDKDHAKSLRQYAHTFHGNDASRICVAEAFLELPRDRRDGLLAHEIGHLIAGPDSSEPAADEAFFVLTGARIRYKDDEHGSCLQWLPAKDAKQLERVVEFDLDFAS